MVYIPLRSAWTSASIVMVAPLLVGIIMTLFLFQSMMETLDVALCLLLSVTVSV